MLIIAQPKPMQKVLISCSEDILLIKHFEIILNLVEAFLKFH